MDGAIISARSGVPGPVYVELPVDLLYPESLVREWYGLKSDSRSMPWWLTRYMNWNVNRIFKDKDRAFSISVQINPNNTSSLHLLAATGYGPILVWLLSSKNERNFSLISSTVYFLSNPGFPIKSYSSHGDSPHVCLDSFLVQKNTPHSSHSHRKNPSFLK